MSWLRAFNCNIVFMGVTLFMRVYVLTTAEFMVIVWPLPQLAGCLV